MSDTTNSEPKYVVRWYVVGLVDILGQGERLRDLDSCETPESAAQVLRETAHTVEKMREAYFDTFRPRAEGPTPFADTLGPEERAAYLSLTTGELLAQTFSDLFLFAVAVDKSHHYCTSMNAIHRMLFWLAGHMLLSVAGGRPLRGAVEIGRAVRLSTGEVYGSPLARAHTLESRVAIYPRILIGENFQRFLRDMGSLNATGKDAEITRRIAGLCAAMCCKDSDNLMILDYLGEVFMRQVPHLRPMGLAKTAYEFAVESEKRFQADEKIREKYKRLLEYMTPRIERWGEVSGG
jgi:hypothetical protein